MSRDRGFWIILLMGVSGLFYFGDPSWLPAALSGRPGMTLLAETGIALAIGGVVAWAVSRGEEK